MTKKISEHVLWSYKTTSDFKHTIILTKAITDPISTALTGSKNKVYNVILGQ
jgi:hypothetical protein